MFGKYKVAHLLGKTRRNEELFRECERILTTNFKYICFAPVVYDLALYSQCNDLLIDMCEAKLDYCDLCVVVTPLHIGESTTTRIKQALKKGIPVYIYDTKSALEGKFNYRIHNEDEVDMWKVYGEQILKGKLTLGKAMFYYGIGE